MKILKFTFLVVFFVHVFFGCIKDTKIEPEPARIKTDSASLVIDFTAICNNKVIVYATGNYTNTSSDNFTITKLNYYISNVKLKREDGYVFVEPESYHLIKHAEGKTSFTINKLPEGNYNHIEFLIGVDSLRNVSGAQVGALDVSNQMFWEWESGYIFFKLEGNYNSDNVPEDNGYSIHIGGFKGEFSCLQTCKINLNQTIVASATKPSKLYFNTVVDEIFKTPKTIGFDTYYSLINDAMFKSISQNYKDMFVVAKVEN